MTNEKKSEKTYTELQQKFLDLLFTEAGGDPNIAKNLAGYGEGTKTSQVVSSLSDEIVELTIKHIAAASPKAYAALINVLEDGGQMGAANKLNAAKEILNRAGIRDKSGEGVNLNVPEGGVVILPAKEYKKDVE